MDRKAVASQLAEPAICDIAWSWAGSGDDAEMRRLMRDVPMAGSVRVGFAREPSYMAGTNLAGTVDRTLVGKIGGRVVIAGACSRRMVWRGDRIAQVGYFNGLRAVPGTARSLRYLRQGFEQWVEEERSDPAELYFTSVASGNTRARRVLESGKLGLPRYEGIGVLETRVMPVGRRDRQEDGLDSFDKDEVSDYLNRQARRYHFGITWNRERWSELAAQGFEVSDVKILRKNGAIVGVAGLWDQRRCRQTVIHGYGNSFRLMRPVLNLGLSCLGRVRIPPVGSVLKQAAIFPFAIEESAASMIDELWRKLSREARSKGIEWLTIGFDQRDPILPKWVKPLGSHSYFTTLYSVELGTVGVDRNEWRERCFRPEVALL